MATTSLDYMGGTPYAMIKVDFSIDAGGINRPICNLTDTSSGILTCTYSGGTSSTWSVNGRTVVRTGGTSTSSAFYVTNGVLYAQNPATSQNATYSGEVENVIIRVDGYNYQNMIHTEQTAGTNMSITASTWTEILSITVGKGIWLAVGGANVYNSDTHAKYVSVGNSNATQPSTQFYPSVSDIFKVSGTASIPLRAYSQGADATVGNGYLRVIKISDI